MKSHSIMGGSVWTIFGIAIVISLGSGCGSPDADVEGLTNVNGNAIFGSQCPYGSFSKPFAAPLNLWDCPLGLKTVDLVQPLRPIVLQADCKKKIIVARTLDGALDTSWEVLPNGTFSFSIDGGYATLKDDGRGGSNCTTQLTAELSGSLDCSDRDKVKINVESVWWLDRVPPRPNPSAAPSSAPTPVPTVTPGPFPTNFPTVAPTPVPTVIPTVLPTVTPTTSPTVRPIFPRPRPTGRMEMFVIGGNPDLGASARKCSVPKSCYFYANTKLQQCE